jgi:acetyl esterase/lipase
MTRGRRTTLRLGFLSLILWLAACAQVAVQPTSTPALGLASEPAAFETLEVDYLQVDGKTYQATIYKPMGRGPFPALLDVHGGGWVNESVRRDEHALLDRALAAMGIVVVAIDFRHSPAHHYPDSVADVNFAMRWLRANATKFNASAQMVGALGSSTGGHLVLLNGMRPADPRYAALPLAGAPPQSGAPDYIIAAYPPSDTVARRAFNEQAGNSAQVRSSNIYFSPPASVQDGNPQAILDRRETRKLPPVLLLQGDADGNGPAMQQRFAASYRMAGGEIQLELVPGAPHNFVNAAGANLDRALELIKAFIVRQLASSFSSTAPIAIPS